MLGSKSGGVPALGCGVVIDDHLCERYKCVLADLGSISFEGHFLQIGEFQKRIGVDIFHLSGNGDGFYRTIRKASQVLRVANGLESVFKYNLSYGAVTGKRIRSPNLKAPVRLVPN